MPDQRESTGFRSVYILAVLFVVVTTCIFVFNYIPQISIMMEKSNAQRSSVVVVGGGLAGLSATIEAVRHGAKVTIIEKEKNLGGNSAKATSGMNGVGTNAQSELGITDSVSQFKQDTLSSGDGLSNEELVHILTDNSGAAIQFITDFGLNLTDVVQLGGHSARRTHRFPPTKEGKPVPVGFTIMSTLKKYVQEELKDFVDVKTSTTFVELVKEKNKVIGVKYRTAEGNIQTVEGAVVLTGGGYGNDHSDTSLLEKYTPHLAKYPTTNGPWATGDVIKATEGEGLSLIHMDKVQVHPTGFVDAKDPNNPTKFLAPEALRGCGAILLNAEGKRFANELGRRDYLTEMISAKCTRFQNKEDNPVVAAMLLSQQVIDKFGPHLVGFYIFKGLINDVKTVKGAATYMGIGEGTLRETIKYYKAQCEAGKDDFEKKAFPTCIDENDHLYVAYITPSLHYCMGGIQINKAAEVLLKPSTGGSGMNTQSGLFAAGEVSGGVHGNNRLGGNSLLECVVFGRIAGKNSAHFGQE